MMKSHCFMSDTINHIILCSKMIPSQFKLHASGYTSIGCERIDHSNKQLCYIECVAGTSQIKNCDQLCLKFTVESIQIQYNTRPMISYPSFQAVQLKEVSYVSCRINSSTLRVFRQYPHGAGCCGPINGSGCNFDGLVKLLSFPTGISKMSMEIKMMVTLDNDVFDTNKNWYCFDN